MKTAFVLSGGGARGSFQVGALKYLCERKRIVPDIVIGISTGSLQGLAVAQQDLAILEQVWLNIKRDSDIYTKSILNYGKCLLGIRNGVYEFDGLRKILSQFFNKSKLMQSPIDFYVGKVSLQETSIVYVNKKDMTVDDVLSSCTIPVFFPTVNRSNLQWVDGGVRDIVPLKKAIDLGADTIFVLLCSPKRANVVYKRYKNVVEVLERVLDILLNEIYVNDIETATRINEMIDKFGPFNNYRKIDIKVIEPDFDISDSLDFDPIKIRRGIQHGYRKAEEIVR
jgi:NTE family protein